MVYVKAYALACAWLRFVRLCVFALMDAVRPCITRGDPHDAPVRSAFSLYFRRLITITCVLTLVHVNCVPPRSSQPPVQCHYVR